MSNYNCARCGGVAGFWVSRTESAITRRPWCMACIEAYLKKAEYVIKRIR